MLSAETGVRVFVDSSRLERMRGCSERIAGDFRGKEAEDECFGYRNVQP